MILFSCLGLFYCLCGIRVITLNHLNEEIRNTNGCYLVARFFMQFDHPIYILSELSFLAKVMQKGLNKLLNYCQNVKYFIPLPTSNGKHV